MRYANPRTHSFTHSQKSVATATSLDGSKNNFRSFIYGQSSTNPAKFVEIGPVNVEINGLEEITKNIVKK